MSRVDLNVSQLKLDEDCGEQSGEQMQNITEGADPLPTASTTPKNRIALRRAASGIDIAMLQSRDELGTDGERSENPLAQSFTEGVAQPRGSRQRACSEAIRPPDLSYLIEEEDEISGERSRSDTAQGPSPACVYTIACPLTHAAIQS